MIASIRTTTGRENVVIDNITIRVKTKKIPIKSLMKSDELKGYIFIEGEINDIEEATKGIPHIRGILKKNVSLSELEKFLVPEKREIKVEIGDIVEIVSSPFKGEKAKIKRIDEQKNEITVEFLESAIPIPVTISMNSVRLYEKAKKNKEKSEE